MRRILASILLYLFLSVSLAWSEVEIYSAGQHYASFDEYRKIEKRAKPLLTNTLSTEEELKLDKISYDHGLAAELLSFEGQKEDGQSKRLIESQSMEDVLRHDIQDQKGPVLLIADSNKMKISSLEENKKIVHLGQ